MIKTPYLVLSITIAIVLTITSFFVGYSLNRSDSGQAESQDTQGKIDSLQQPDTGSQQDGNGLEQRDEENMRRIVLDGNLSVSCPVGIVCDENYDYRAYNYQDDDFGGIYFSFEPAIVKDYDLQSFTDNFNYVSVQLDFPEKSSDLAEAYYQTLNGIREIKFVSYENNILSGEFNLSVDKITIRTPGDCVYDDIAGWCYRYEDVNEGYTVEFHMRVPE